MRIATATCCLLTLLLPACTASPSPGVSYQFSRSSGNTQKTLFPTDSVVISDGEIARILAAEPTTPQDARVAVVRLDWPQPWRWSEEIAALDAATIRGLTDALEASSHVRDASLLPSMLAPPSMTVPHLRAAAARYQAEFLLVFRVQTQSYENQKFLQAQQTRAYSHIEAVLIDVRTGIAPFATLATESFDAKKTGDELTFAETIRKAELRAIGAALQQVGAEATTYFAERAAG